MTALGHEARRITLADLLESATSGRELNSLADRIARRHDLTSSERSTLQLLFARRCRELYPRATSATRRKP